MLIWRYVRHFVKMDAREALQYVYCICLSADQGDDVGQEQVESAWELVRRIIVLAHSGTAWEELVGDFRPDGTRFVSTPAFELFFRDPYDETEWIDRAGGAVVEATRPETIQ